MFLILVVLYNKTLNQSATLNAIIKSAAILNTSGSKVLLRDNSIQKMLDVELKKLTISLNDFEYVHSPENFPLSKIYNQTLQQGLQANFNYLVLLDDDSNISTEYFAKAFTAAAGNNYALIIPIVKNKGVIRSPMRSYILKGFTFSHLKPGIFPSQNLMAINSGMIISFNFLQTTQFKYDVRLNNYATDSYFMKFYASKRKKLFILDYTFEHSLSFFDVEDIDKKVSIFKQTKTAYLILHSNNRFNFLMASAYNFMSSLKNAIKYRTLQFFK